MKEEKDDVRGDITNGTSVKLPIGLIAGAMAGIALAWWSQFEAHKHYDNERFDELRSELYKKASDRYTGTQARQFEESVKQRFLDIEKANAAERRTLQYQIEECQRHTCVGE